jgi:hypothetical protein
MLNQILLCLFLQDITLPQSINAQPNTFVIVQAQTKGKEVKFVPLSAGLSIFPSDLLVSKTQTVVLAAKSGKYQIGAYTAIQDKPSEFVITTINVAGDSMPDPVKPDAIPQLQLDLQSAYDKNKDANKAIDKANAVLVFRNALGKLDGAKTAGEVNELIRKERVALIPNNLSFSGEKQLVSDYLKANLGQDSDTLLDPVKTKSILSDIAKALEGVK